MLLVSIVEFSKVIEMLLAKSSLFVTIVMKKILIVSQWDVKAAFMLLW